MKTDDIGTAKCHGSDAFDERTDRNIASMKSDIKIEQGMSVEYRKTAETLRRAAEEAERLAAKHTERRDRMMAALAEYTKGK